MRVKFFTLGCKVNQYETQALKERFLSRGLTLTNQEADLYIVNTCSVTRRADRKSREAVLKAKRENSQAKIAVTGCLAQRDREVIEALGVDYIIPQDKKAFLDDIILSGGNCSSRDVWSLKISNFPNKRAFVKIQDGCNNFCSFCKIPYLRGKPSSRSKEEVIEEVKRLSLSYQEIVLCGVNLALYGKDFQPPFNLASLVKEILEIPSLKRLRLSSLEPYLIDGELILLFHHKKLCPHLHLCFQSGDNEVLKRMNKREKVSLYEDIVERIREVNPDIAISCDIIVGFPYEKEKNFTNTVNFLKRVEPMRMHIFTFSPRPFTPFSSWKVKNQIIIGKRYRFLKELAKEFSQKYFRKFIGKRLFMVAEEYKGEYTTGYTENYIKVHLKKRIPLGDIVPVIIERVEDKGVFVYLG